MHRSTYSPHTLLASQVCPVSCTATVCGSTSVSTSKGGSAQTLSSTLKGRSCCHTLPLPPPCSSPPSLHVDSVPAGLFCLPVSSVPQTSSSPSSVLRTSGGGEDMTIFPHLSSLTNRTTRLKTRTLLDHSGGVVSSILEQQGRGQGVDRLWRFSSTQNREQLGRSPTHSSRLRQSTSCRLWEVLEETWFTPTLTCSGVFTGEG